MFYIFASDISNPNNKTMIYHLANPELYLNQPKLTLEIGKAGSLEFGIMPDHAYYDRLSQLTTLVTVDYDDVEIFRGRVLSNTRDFQNMRQVYCEGDLSYLVDTVQKFSKYEGTVHALFRQIIANHNTRIKDAAKKFTVGNITVENRNIKLAGQSDENINVGNIDYKQIAINSITDEWNTTYDLIQTCIIDYVGGYLNTRRQNGVTYIDLLAAPSDTDVNTTTQEIELGVNMLDLEEEVTAEDLFTVLIPLGDDNLTIASVNNGSDELADTNAVNRYGRIIKTHVFSNVNEASTLLENGRRYLASNINIPTTLTINALDMHIINKTYDPIHLCDKVHIKSTRHSILEYLTCTKIEYDLENPGNDTYTFGNPTQTLTQRYREDRRKESDTYDSSGHGGGGGAAAAAAEAAAGAGEAEMDSKLDSFYDAYIDIDPEHGTITLGTLYNETVHMINTLAECGISMESNPEQANVNIQTLYQKTNDLTGEVQANSTSIQQLSTSTSSQISLVASSVSTLGDKVDGNSKSIASIILRADAQGDSIVSINADIIELNGKIDSIEANYITVGSLAGQIAAINQVSMLSGYVSGNFSVGNKISGGSFSLTDGTSILGSNHVHNVVESNGKVTIGTATTTVGNNSFNIADTKFYKDGVKAAKTEGAESATLSSLGIDGAAGSPYDYNSSKYADVKIKYKVTATRGDGTVYSEEKTLTKAVQVASIWSAVTISSIASNGTATYETANKRYKVPVKATASNGNSSTNNLYVSATDAINAGKTEGANSVTISSIAFNGSATYQTSYNRYVVPVKATASNGKTGTNNLYVGASDAFNAGKTEGANSVTINSLGATWSGYTLSATARASNGASKTGSWDATWIYNSGYSDGEDNVDVGYSGGSWDIWNNGTYRDEDYVPYGVSIGVSLTNGTTRYQFLYI